MAEGKLIKVPQFRQAVQGLAIEGARFPVKRGAGCAVDVARCVGLDEDAFMVLDVAAGAEVYFCKRHALAAEALVSYAGYRGVVVPKLLALLDKSELDPDDGPHPVELKGSISGMAGTATLTFPIAKPFRCEWIEVEPAWSAHHWFVEGVRVAGKDNLFHKGHALWEFLKRNRGHFQLEPANPGELIAIDFRVDDHREATRIDVTLGGTEVR
jgi:hypothetical protein